MSTEDIAAMGNRIRRLERLVAELCARENIDVPDLLAYQAKPTGFASDQPTGFASDQAVGVPPSDTGFASIDASADPQIATLIQTNDLIQAIKRYRELTGAGLREAKDAIDELAKQNRGMG